MEFEIINNKEINLADKGYWWKEDKNAKYGFDQEYWSYQEQIHDESVVNAFDSFAEGHEPVCKGDDGKLYSVMFRVSKYEDGSYWYRPVIWQEVEPKSKKTYERLDWKTEFWMNTNIRIECIGGERYALDGWNGEKYTSCWKCIDKWTADPEGAKYEIAPVYDWSKWNDDAGEFQDADGCAIDGIIGYEVL